MFFQGRSGTKKNNYAHSIHLKTIKIPKIEGIFLFLPIILQNI